MTIPLIIYSCGIHAIVFAIFHMFFWRLFKWKIELKKLSLANRAIMQISNLRLIYFFLFVGFTCFFYNKELATTRLGHVFLIGLAIFWLGRTVEQLIFLPISSVFVNILTGFFILGTTLFALAAFL